jgi:hypothetical protein
MNCSNIDYLLLIKLIILEEPLHISVKGREGRHPSSPKTVDGFCRPIPAPVPSANAIDQVKVAYRSSTPDECVDIEMIEMLLIKENIHVRRSVAEPKDENFHHVTLYVNASGT